MKKIILCLIMLSFLILTACSSKTAITVETFKSTMEDSGYTIADATDQFEEGTVESVYIAAKEEYQIEFYTIPSVDQAKSAYNLNKTDIESTKGSLSSSKSVSINNYSYYTLTTEEKYNVVSRVDNTFLYVSSPVEHKDEISSIVSKLGY